MRTFVVQIAEEALTNLRNRLQEMNNTDEEFLCELISTASFMRDQRHHIEGISVLNIDSCRYSRR